MRLVVQWTAFAEIARHCLMPGNSVSEPAGGSDRFSTQPINSGRNEPRSEMYAGRDLRLPRRSIFRALTAVPQSMFATTALPLVLMVMISTAASRTGKCLKTIRPTADDVC